MAPHAPRKFEVPAALVAAGFGDFADLDTLDREVEFNGEFGDWAEKVLYQENAKILEEVCGDMRLLPRGLVSSVQLDDGSLLIEGLVDSEGRVWDSQFNAWGVPSVPLDVLDTSVLLDDDEVAFVARALREGADEVWFRPYIPKAFVSAVVAAPPPPQDRLGKKARQPETPPENVEVPEGSAIIAVVDPIDDDAVLEMLAITPGPRALRRHDGNWHEDPAWVPVLKSIQPPKIVKLTEAQVASVTAQVDRSTADQDWEPFDADTRDQYQIFTASAGTYDSDEAIHRSPYLQKLQNEADEKALQALIAVAGRKLTPKDAASTERLKRYWTVGKGAAKIRWGTPGSWRRCYRHLVKYVGPKIAPGLCTNLSQRLGGPGIATHVTSSAQDPALQALNIPESLSFDGVDDGRLLKELRSMLVAPITAANPTGENGYDNGQRFNESSVSRGYAGRFAPKGTNRAARKQRRDASISRSRKAREEKEAKKAGTTEKKAETERKKAETERNRAKREAQQEQLADLSLQISEAAAAGDTVKAAELRVARAELRLSFAETTLERTNAQTALNNARAALNRAIRAERGRQPEAPTPEELQRRRELMREFEARYGPDGMGRSQ